MTVLRLGIVWFTLLTVVSAQLQCHKEQTNTYQYHNAIKVWGEVQQTFEVSCIVTIDCNGESSLSTEEKIAFDFGAQFSDLVVTEKKVRSDARAKLCKPSQGADSTCGPSTSTNYGENNSHKKNDEDEKVTPDDALFSQPVSFTQTTDGKIIRIQFTEKDLENVDVLNMKKGIISALQTHIKNDSTEAIEDEMDSNGRHKTHYRSYLSGDATVIIKEYDSEEDVDGKEIDGKVHVKEETTVQDGEITSSIGVSSSQLKTVDDSDQSDGPPDVPIGIKVGDLLKTESNYKLNLKNKQNRSIERTNRIYSFGTTKFIDTPITMTTKQRNQGVLLDRLAMLYGRLKQTSVSVSIKNFLGSKVEANLHTIREIITLERNIGYEKVKVKLSRTEPPLVDTLAHHTSGLLAECHANWDTCLPLLTLFAIGGGKPAEQVFKYMLSEDSQLTLDQSMDMVDMASTMANPSNEYIRMILDVYRSESTDTHVTRSLLLVLGSLAGQDSVSANTKSVVRSIILTQLTDITERNCTEDEKYVDALEAAGNMADEELLGILVQIGSTCNTSRILQIGVLHAVRGLLNNPSTVNLLITILESGDCEVSEEILYILTTVMADMRSEDTVTEWPLVGLNEFDHAIEYMLTQTENLHCIFNTAIKYFRKKVQTDAEAILTRLTETGQHPQTKGTVSLRKRSLKHATCSLWEDHRGKYSNIQPAYAFQLDLSYYSTRQHCLSHFRVGQSDASAEVYSGLFAGCGTGFYKERLFERVMAYGEVLTHRYSIAEIYTFFYTYGTNSIYRYSRIYARVGKRTSYLLTTSAKPNYRINRIMAENSDPRQFNVPVITSSINIYMSVSTTIHFELNLHSCYMYGTSTCLGVFTRINSRASAQVLFPWIATQAGTDVYFNFNYHLKSEMETKPACEWPCIFLSHGYDINSIDMEFWYQRRNWWGWLPRDVHSKLRWETSRPRERTIASTCPLPP